MKRPILGKSNALSYVHASRCIAGCFWFLGVESQIDTWGLMCAIRICEVGFLKHLEAARIAGGGLCNFLQCWQKLAAHRAQTASFHQIQRRRIDFVMNKRAGEFSNQAVQPSILSIFCRSVLVLFQF